MCFVVAYQAVNEAVLAIVSPTCPEHSEDPAKVFLCSQLFVAQLLFPCFRRDLLFIQFRVVEPHH